MKWCAFILCVVMLSGCASHQILKDHPPEPVGNGYYKAELLPSPWYSLVIYGIDNTGAYYMIVKPWWGNTKEFSKAALYVPAAGDAYKEWLNN